MNQTKELHNHLIDACKNNDAKAQMRLYDLYCKAMCAIANRDVKDSFVAEDIMQDSFIKAFQNIHSFKGEVSFGAWLKRIVINNSLDWLKKRKLEIVSINEEVYERVEENDDWSVSQSLQAEFIANAIKNLKEKLQILQADKVKTNKTISKDFTLNGKFYLKNSSVDIKGNQSKITIKKQ